MKTIITILVMLLFYSLGITQGIRKHYTELTESEREDYIGALDELISQGIVDDYADFHVDPNGSASGVPAIHGVEDFLPWHRQFIVEFERELQGENDEVTIPYWDWTGDSDPNNVDSRSTTGPLWANNQIATLSWTDNFLGKYDGPGSAIPNLNRLLGARSSLPTSTAVDNLLLHTDFTIFQTDLEGGIHNPPHNWVGGEMSTFRSPRDPVFYFHHAMVDKLWQLWTEDGNASSFTNNVMPTFDGTITQFSNVNPNNITDSRTLGIFYSDAASQTAELSLYSVTNDHLAIEKFKYQYEIIAENDFIIPDNKSAELLSTTTINFREGFHAENGASLVARIHTDLNTFRKKENDHAIRQIEGELLGATVFPNPTNGLFKIRLLNNRLERGNIKIQNVRGQIVKEYQMVDSNELVLDISDQPNGVYFIQIENENRIHTSKLIKQ